MSASTQLHTNYSHVCAVNNGYLFCWGANGYETNSVKDYRIDSGPAFVNTVNTGIPTRPITTSSTPGFAQNSIQDFAMTDLNICILVTGKVYCWGYNEKGQLGQGHTLGADGAPAPARIDGTGSVSASKIRAANNMVRVNGSLQNKVVERVTAGNDHFCAITREKESYCWGANDRGALGVGSTAAYISTPTRVNLPSRIIY